jgi:hypothetical protein
MLRALNLCLVLTTASSAGIFFTDRSIAPVVQAAAEKEAPTVSSGPSKLWANVHQLQQITVRGSFETGTNISCRVVDAPCVYHRCPCDEVDSDAATVLSLQVAARTYYTLCRACARVDDGTNFCPYCQSPAEVPRPGRVINSTAASCVVAGSASGILNPEKDAGHGGSPGFAAGSGQLMFSTDNRSWPHKGWPLDFVPLCDSAIGRRPYFSNETEAELIVSLGAPLSPGTAVSICASALGRDLFACTNIYPTADGRSTVIPFNLSTLPPAFNATISVNFSCDALGLSGSLERW